MASTACVKRHCFSQGIEITRMHVGLGQHNVAQAGHPKTRSLTGISTGGGGTRVERKTIFLRHAEHSDLLVGKKGWGVALSTASDEGAKNIEAFDFRFGQSTVHPVGV